MEITETKSANVVSSMATAAAGADFTSYSFELTKKKSLAPLLCWLLMNQAVLITGIINSDEAAASEISKLTSINATLYVQNVNESKVVSDLSADPFTISPESIKQLGELPLEKLLVIKKQLEELTATGLAAGQQQFATVEGPYEDEEESVADPKFDVGYVEQGGFMPMRTQPNGEGPYDPNAKLDVYNGNGFITPQPFISDVK